MSVLGDRRLRRLVAAFVLVVFGLVGVVGLGVAAAVSALLSVGPSEFVLVALLEATAAYILAFVGLGLAGVGLLAWTLLRAIRIAELPRSDRLADAVARAEAHAPLLADLGLSEVLSPTPADRREALKERYARGELTEAEFEREMASLLDDADGVDDGSEFDERVAFDDGTAFESETDDGVVEGVTEDGDRS